MRIGEDHRAQLSFGDGAVIVADVRHAQRPPRPGEVTHTVVVRVEDARAHCEHARAGGARIHMEPTDFEYGERQYSAEDLAGHHWTFSETLADVAPEEWGGTSVGHYWTASTPTASPTPSASWPRPSSSRPSTRTRSRSGALSAG